MTSSIPPPDSSGPVFPDEVPLESNESDWQEQHQIVDGFDDEEFQPEEFRP